MALFEEVEFSERTKIAISITDDSSQTARLSPAQALDLLRWLFERQDTLEILAQPPTQPLSAEPTERANEE